MLNNRALAVPDSVPKRMGPERNTRLSGRGRRRAGLAAWALLVVAHLLPAATGYHSSTSSNEVPDNLELARSVIIDCGG